MESVIWAFKQLYDKGLVYEGFRVLPYCWNDETPLSNHELRMDDDVYQIRQDPAVTVGLRLETGELALVWTTTPWTLPANLGIMVGPDIDYVVVESDATGSPERYVIGGGAARGVRARTSSRTRTTRRSTSSSGSRAPTCVGRHVSCRRSPTTLGHPNAHQVFAGRLRHHRGRHRAGPHAPAPSVRRTRSSPTPPGSSRSSRSAPTAGSPTR